MIPPLFPTMIPRLARTELQIARARMHRDHNAQRAEDEDVEATHRDDIGDGGMKHGSLTTTPVSLTSADNLSLTVEILL